MNKSRFNIVNVFLIVLSVLTIVQAFSARSVSAGWDFGLLLPLLLGISGLLFVLLRLVKKRPLITQKKHKQASSIIIIAVLCIFVAVESTLFLDPIFHGAEQFPEEIQEPWVIVLGCRIKEDGFPTWALQNRLDEAMVWGKTRPGTRYVVSGGQGPNEPISEGLAMAQYLQSRGVEKEQITVEDASTSTMENFRYSLLLIQKQGYRGEPVLFVTNDFHVFRARILARRNGLDAYGIGASTPFVILPNVYLREFFALFKSLAFDW